MRTFQEITDAMRETVLRCVAEGKVVKVEGLGFFVTDPELVSVLEVGCREVCVYDDIRVLTPLQPSE